MLGSYYKSLSSKSNPEVERLGQIVLSSLGSHSENSMKSGHSFAVGQFWSVIEPLISNSLINWSIYPYP